MPVKNNLRIESSSLGIKMLLQCYVMLTLVMFLIYWSGLRRLMGSDKTVYLNFYESLLANRIGGPIVASYLSRDFVFCHLLL